MVILDDTILALQMPSGGIHPITSFLFVGTPCPILSPVIDVPRRAAEINYVAKASRVVAPSI
jgi:hypothetical protein